MAEQTYDLTQEGADVQAIINDANNMKGAGAQTTLTTESVLLKDVNGQYHKILKSSFTEAIRDTLAGLLVNNDKGATINQIAAIASGDFGSVTPANLASVLGDSKTKLLVTSSSGAHRKLVFSNYVNCKSYATIYYSKFGNRPAIYNVFRTQNGTWVLTPIVENSEQPITDINDIAISSYSALTVTAFNCDVSIDPIS